MNNYFIYAKTQRLHLKGFHSKVYIFQGLCIHKYNYSLVIHNKYLSFTGISSRISLNSNSEEKHDHILQLNAGLITYNNSFL